MLRVCAQPADIKSARKLMPLILSCLLALSIAAIIFGSPKVFSSKPKTRCNSSNVGARSKMVPFKSSFKTLLSEIDPPPEGAFIRLAKPEIMSKTITKKMPNAVKVPKIDAKKLFIKFIIKLLVLQI